MPRRPAPDACATTTTAAKARPSKCLSQPRACRPRSEAYLRHTARTSTHPPRAYAHACDRPDAARARRPDGAHALLQRCVVLEKKNRRVQRHLSRHVQCRPCVTSTPGILASSWYFFIAPSASSRRSARIFRRHKGNLASSSSGGAMPQYCTAATAP